MTQASPSSNKTLDYAEEIGLVPVSLKTAAWVIQLCAYDRHVPLLIGETSTGKTAILRQLAEYNELDFLFYGLAHKEASDLTGPMMPSSDGVTFQHLPPANIPIKGHAGEDRFVMMDLAEVNRADSTVHNAAFQVWTDRQLGTHELGENVIVVSDMNPPDGDYAVTSSFSSDPAMRRRTCQIVVNFSVNDLLAWAKDPASATQFNMPKLSEDGVLEPVGLHRKRPWHPSVVEFLQANVDIALDRQARDAGKIFACPSTWHACSDTLYTLERLEIDTSSASMQLALLTKLAGHIGHTHAKSLLEYHNREASALDPRDMLLHFADEDNRSCRRVEKLLEAGHAGHVAGALNNLAIVWAEGVEAEEFTSEDCAPHLAKIFNMVPTDVGGQLLDAIVDADSKVGASTGGPSQRSTGLVRLLHKQPAFKEFRDRRTENLRDKQQRERVAEEGLE